MMTLNTILILIFIFYTIFTITLLPISALIKHNVYMISPI